MSKWGAPATGFRKFRAESFDAGEVCLHVVRGPKAGPPILLLPGLNDPWFSYQDVMIPLSRRFTVYVVDHRGHGPSGRSNTDSYRVVDYARDIAALLRQGIGEPTFVAGNSLGALIAAHLAATERELIRGCVLEDGPFFITEPRRWSRSPLRLGLFADIAERVEHAEREGISEAAFVRAYRNRPWGFAPDGDWAKRAVFLGKFMALLAPSWTSLRPRERQRLIRGYKGLLDGRRLCWLDVFPDAWIAEAARRSFRIASACARAATRSDFSAGLDHAATLRALRCPTLVLEADRDLVGLLPPADLVRLMSCLARVGGVHRLCDGALHAIHQSHPVLYVDAVTSFLLDEPVQEDRR